MAVYCGFLAVLLGAGTALGLKIFTLNDYGVQLVFYLLWGNLQVTWAYYISAVMASTQAAVIWAVSINIFSGLIANLVMVGGRGGGGWGQACCACCTARRHGIFCCL
jgi:hypothetical protein